MIPLTGVFRKMERLVRDLMRQTNKDAEFVISGESTEIDKSMVELIEDPLVHILRNAIDHGIESAEIRESEGKSKRGTISLTAAHSGKEVWITIKDNGKGLDRDKIIEKAIEKGMIEGTGENLSDNEVWNLIFLPGLSTAAEVTGISGRGVGMDVVKRNISKIGGTVSIESMLDEGTTFYLKIPLTLAIIDGMIVKYAGRFFVIPSIDVQETVNINEVHIYSVDSGANVMNYRNQLIPVIRLDHFMKMKNKNKPEDSKYIVILEFEQKCVGVIFDDILGNQSIVIKPLSEIFQKVQGVSGCTILGNGIVGLILDVNYLVEKFYIKESSIKKTSG
jgi:two-component system chemotaxis sensor kinase CheA